jgi:uncharacterized membrane protein YeaQ/YmgE (transglycosylase-associated protein family)
MFCTAWSTRKCVSTITAIVGALVLIIITTSRRKDKKKTGKYK